MKNGTYALCHCEERSDAAIPQWTPYLDGFVRRFGWLAMTTSS